MAGAVAALILVSLLGAGAKGATTVTEDALLALPAACTNWDAATAEVPGTAWAAGTPPCGNSSAAAWGGVKCDPGGSVTELRLPGLGLEGTLPAQLAALQDLVLLNLSTNAFEGSIPGSWMQPDTFATLEVADLSYNQLSGTLPQQMVLLASRAIHAAGCNFKGALPAAWRSDTLELLDLSFNSISAVLPTAWGDKTALPRLIKLRLQGNAIRGPIPDPQWTSVGFAAPCTVHLRPGNPALCGPLLALSPQLYDEALIENPTLVYTINKPQQGSLSNTTTLIVTQDGLFSAASHVTVTNTLGSCAMPCTAGLGSPTSSTITTNFFDVTWQMNVSAADLLELNPGAGSASAGTALNMPCYPGDNGPVPALGLNPSYFGGDVAYLKFTGGNQREGFAGLAGAMAASGTNDHPPFRNDFDGPYTGALGGENGSVWAEYTQPIYLFVDLQAAFKVASMILTAGNVELRNASVHVGSDPSSVTNNKRVVAGVNVAANQTVALAAGGAEGRFVIIYTGMVGEGQMSISDFQVYTEQTNAAVNKPVTVPGVALGTPSVLVDNDQRTCLSIEANSDGNTAWAAVDLGYTACVGSVVIATGPNSPANTSFRAYVKPSLEASTLDSQACNNAGMEVRSGGGWAAVPCNATGRWVVVAAPASRMFELCELQVGLTQPPAAANNGGKGANGGGSSLSSGAIAGIVVGSTAVLAALVLALLFVVRRRRERQGSGEAKPGLATGKDSLQAVEHGQGSSSHLGSSAQASGGTAGDAGREAAAAAAAAMAAHEAAESAAVLVPPVLGAETVPELPPPAGDCFTQGSVSGGSSSHALRCSPSSAGISAEASATDLSKLAPGFHDVKASEFQLVRPIGSGSFGQVFAARWSETLVAVKMLTHQSAPNSVSSLQHAALLRNLQREAELMSRLRHPNVTQYLGACLDPPALLMELCAKKSIDTVLSQGLTDARVAKQLSWGRLLSMALDAAKGLWYLHSRQPPIVHRDLKSANLLVDNQWHVKVADFNLSREAGLDTGSSIVTITNPRWLAPEMLAGRSGQLPADIWAFGTVLWEIATWRLPFESNNPFQIITHVQAQTSGSGLTVPAAEELPAGPFSGWQQYVELMQDCWQRDEAARPTCDAIVQRLRALLSDELKQQHQLKPRGGDEASFRASLEVPPTPLAASCHGLGPTATSTLSSGLLAGPAASPAAAALPLPATVGAAETGPSPAPLAGQASNGVGAGQPERMNSSALEAASPFATASKQALPITPPEPDSDR